MINLRHDPFVPRDRTRGTENASPEVARKGHENEEVELNADGVAGGAIPDRGCSDDRAADDPTEPDRLDEIEALIEAYLASWETKDEEVLRASVADTFVVNEYVYTLAGRLSYSINDDADGIVAVGFGYGWENETVGESLVTGDGPWTVAHRELWREQANQYDGIATYVVIDDGETLKITNHHWAGFVRFES